MLFLPVKKPKLHIISSFKVLEYYVLLQYTENKFPKDNFRLARCDFSAF